jgi:hypothetical protein
MMGSEPAVTAAPLVPVVPLGVRFAVPMRACIIAQLRGERVAKDGGLAKINEECYSGVNVENDLGSDVRNWVQMSYEKHPKSTGLKTRRYNGSITCGERAK